MEIVNKTSFDVETKFCTHCDIWVPVTSQHCYKEDCCVKEYYFHSSVFANSIGTINVKSYIFFYVNSIGGKFFSLI